MSFHIDALSGVERCSSSILCSGEDGDKAEGLDMFGKRIRAPVST